MLTFNTEKSKTTFVSMNNNNMDGESIRKIRKCPPEYVQTHELSKCNK